MRVYTVADALAECGVKDVSRFRHLQMPFKLKPHQVKGVNLCLRKPRTGLFFEARTGKTIVFQLVVLYCAAYQVKSIILMPPILFLQYLESWEEIQGEKPTTFVFRQGPKRREAELKKWRAKGGPDVLVMTKEIFKKHWKELQGLGHQLLVFDESHMGLAKDSTQTYKAVKEFVGQSPEARLILSTGTPIPSGLEGAYPTISLLNPAAYMDEAHFYRLHVEMGKVTQKITRAGRTREVLIDVPTGYKDIGRIHANLYLNAVRATKAEVLNIDKPNIQTVPIELAPQHQRIYQTLLKQRILEIGDRMISAIQAQKLRNLSLRLISSPKNYTDKKFQNAPLTALDQILHSSGIDVGEKVAIFANFKESVVTVTEYLRHYGAVSVFGDNTANQNAANVKRFQTQKDCQVLVLNPRAGGVGLKLGHVCTTVVFFEPVGSPGEFDQAMSRVILEGQTKPVVCYILKIVGTISPKAIRKMLERNQQIKQANQDKATLLDELSLV